MAVCGGNLVVAIGWWQLVGGSLLVAIGWWQLVGGSLLVTIGWWQLVGDNWLVGLCPSERVIFEGLFFLKTMVLNQLSSINQLSHQPIATHQLSPTTYADITCGVIPPYNVVCMWRVCDVV